jgi:polyisoprenoid-binding protein YceI
MKRITLAVLTTALLASTGAFAAPETYVIDTYHTYPRFEYSHFGYSTQVHKFDKTSGKITIDRAAKTGAADISIDVNSIDTGYDVFNGHLKGEDFFDAAKFPTITFKSDKFKFEGDKPVALDGQLTIKGITKPVTLTVTSFNCMPHPMAKKDACGANATAKIKRTEFNNGKYAPYVSDDVTLSINVEAIKE